MYYLHFGHVSFYHPRLLSFLLEHEGFGSIAYDVNPNTASPLLPAVQATAGRAPLYAPGKGQSLPYQRTIPPQGASLLHKLSYAIKRRLAQWLVLPFTDNLAAVSYERLAALENELQALGRDIQGINGPFECFATGVKPINHSASNSSPIPPLTNTSTHP
jgi:hypothetical protein